MWYGHFGKAENFKIKCGLFNYFSRDIDNSRGFLKQFLKDIYGSANEGL